MECKKCGVAFDMGRTYCVELGCGIPLPMPPPKAKRVYKYARREAIIERHASLRYRAKKRGMACTITINELKALLLRSCVYCGASERIQLDRKDNLIGYTPDNVVPACKRCNTVKSMYLTYDQMRIVAKTLGWCI